MAALTAGLLAAQITSSFLGQRQQANAAIAQGNYQAGVYNQDAQLADSQSADAISRGQTQEAARYGAGRQEMGSIRANAGASGTTDSGSTTAVEGQSLADTGLDMAQIRNNAARQAWGFNVDATQYRGQAKLAQYAGQNTAAGLRADAYGTLLTGAAKGYEQYRNYQNNRVPKQGT